jgi:hypothetical protein
MVNYEQIKNIEIDTKIHIQSEITHFLRFNFSKNREFYNEIVENWFIGQLVKGETVSGKQILDLLHSMRLY